MTKRELGVLTFRLLACYCLLNTTRYFSATIGAVAQFFYVVNPAEYVVGRLVSNACATVMQGAFGIILWQQAGRLTRAVFGDLADDEQSQVTSSLSRADCWVVGLGGLGLWALITSLPNLTHQFAYTIQYAMGKSRYSPGWLFFVSPTIQAALGFGLLLYSTRLGRRVRDAVSYDQGADYTLRRE